ncbi:MAG: hydrogenase expression/formation protein [Gammaproteobacteria bacterium]|nr:hydrogenase expression/formation protein [Gammaproteobacteria bacterium]
MKNIPIPIVAIGPGSQASEDDEMAILNLPSGMATFHQPILPEPEDVEALERAREVLEATLAALRTYRCGDKPKVIELAGVDADNIDLINQAMGEGEVSARLEGDGPVLAQESVLAGVWRVQYLDQWQQVVRDTLEVADIPHFVRQPPNTCKALDLDFDGHPLASGNAPSLLAEIRDAQQAWQPGDDAHVINLSLLPVSEEELALLGERIGVGEVTLLSRGYGNCRIGSTRLRHVWWIKFYNSEDRMILNTVEISDVPAVALAAQEDIDDSAVRLDEILELYR